METTVSTTWPVCIMMAMLFSILSSTVVSNPIDLYDPVGQVEFCTLVSLFAKDVAFVRDEAQPIKPTKQIIYDDSHNTAMTILLIAIIDHIYVPWQFETPDDIQTRTYVHCMSQLRP